MKDNKYKLLLKKQSIFVQRIILWNGAVYALWTI
jgi:hypothetical protein